MVRDWWWSWKPAETSREQMRAAARQADRAAVGNPRSRRWTRTLESARTTPTRLELVVHMVEEVGLVMSEERRPHLVQCAELRDVVVDGLHVLAETVRSVPVPDELSRRGAEVRERLAATYDAMTFPTATAGSPGAWWSSP